jgi:endonuclease YncB( thermonuclease family)
MEYRAELHTVHDGDTQTLVVEVQATIHLPGMTMAQTLQVPHPVRLAGINAPELTTATGKAAQAWAAQWYADNPGPYVLTTGTRETEKYGRYLGRITAASGRVINDDIVAAGHAVPYIVS